MLLTRRRLLQAVLPLVALPLLPRPAAAKDADSGGGGPQTPPDDPTFAADNAAYWADPAFGDANNAYWHNMGHGIVVLPPGVQVAQFAAGYLGTPYVAGGETPRGWDCSGMMRWVYAQFGVYLSRVTTTQVREGLRVDPGDLLPGDLLFYNTLPPNPGHVGMYLGNGQMVNALNERAGTVISDIWDSYWAPRFYGARRAI